MDNTPTNQIPIPPLAEPRPVKSVHHGLDHTDDYAWLRADNWQEVMRDPTALAADIREHLLAENAYTKAVLARHGGAPGDAVQGDEGPDQGR